MAPNRLKYPTALQHYSTTVPFMGTTTGLDATHPPAICRNFFGGGGGGGRDLLERGGRGGGGPGEGGRGSRGNAPPPPVPEHAQSTVNRKIIGE